MSEVKRIHATTPFGKGNVLFRQGAYFEAIEYYLEAIDANPNFAYYYINLSSALCEYADKENGDVNNVLERLSVYGKPVVTPEIYKITRESKFVNSKWYVKHYSSEVPSGADAILHYLALGWRLGFNPCKRFDNQFYLREHLQEMRDGESPLLHYLRDGKKNNKPIKSEALTAHVAANLWGGHSLSALEALKDIYKDDSTAKNQRWWALWHAARWRYFSGEIAEAERLSIQMDDLGLSFQQRKESVYLRYFSRLLQGKKKEAQDTIEAYLRQVPQDADALLAYSNCLESDKARLDTINQAYVLHGLVGIEKFDAEQPLSIGNIKGLRAATYQDEPKISIVMPIYEAEAQIEIAIRSLLAQSYQNIEIIAVDDCSPDHTFSVLKELEKQDARVRAVQPPENGGAYAARNYGLRFTTGEFLTTHDSDDWSHPQKIETQVRYLQQHRDIKGCAIHWIRAQEDLRFTQNWRPNNVLTHWSQSSFMFRREVLDTIGEWDHVRIGGDTEYIWRMQAQFGKKAFAKIYPEIPLAFALDEESSLTRTKATHVRTVYFGLRHIYREICAWWHNTGHELYVQDAKQKRTFPAPRTMFERGEEPLGFNAVIAGDFSRVEDCQKAATYIGKHPKQKVALFHWPSFHKAPETLCNLYFEQLLQGKVEPVVMGQVVKATDYYVTDMSLLEFPLDGCPGWVGLKNWNNLS